MTKALFTSTELLLAWEEKFGELQEEQKKEFTSRNEVKQLISIPQKTVITALASGPRLSNILREALRLDSGKPVRPKSFSDYPKEWVRLVRKYETNTEMALGALAFRAMMEARMGRVRQSDLRNSPKETKNLEGTTALEKGIEIVGESFYNASFSAIRRQLSIGHSGERVLSGLLRNEPGNPHSISGKAVQVLVEGKIVGYLPERLAPGVFGLLEPDGGEMRVRVRVWFDDERNSPQRNSVRVLGKSEKSRTRTN